MEVLRILRRDIGSQFAVSRNLKESILRKALRTLWSCVYLLKAFRCAVSAMRHEQLGSRVIWDGRECFVCNWANSEYMTISGHQFYKAMTPFKCPKCGGPYFSRDVGAGVALDTVQCNGESSAGPGRCDWRGVWPVGESSEESSND